MTDAEIKMCKELLLAGRTTVFLGGAGVSTESGLLDFRSEEGRAACMARFSLPPETILRAGFFHRETALFYDYYRRFLLGEAQPNAAHRFLADMQRRGRLQAIITQNVDMLHEQAGAKRVIKLHGSVDMNRCISCWARYDAAFIRAGTGVPRCTRCGGLIKPEITLYDEPVDDYVFRNARACMFAADTLIVGGTSLQVYPAASLPEFFMGKRLLVINKTETPLDAQASLVLREPIAAVFAELAGALLPAACKQPCAAPPYR